MERLFNVWALQSGSYEYRSIAILDANEEQPDTLVLDHEWVRIGYRVEQREAEAIADQYPHAARAKC